MANFKSMDMKNMKSDKNFNSHIIDVFTKGFKIFDCIFCVVTLVRCTICTIVHFVQSGVQLLCFIFQNFKDFILRDKN